MPWAMPHDTSIDTCIDMRLARRHMDVFISFRLVDHDGPAGIEQCCVGLPGRMRAARRARRGELGRFGLLQVLGLCTSPTTQGCAGCRQCRALPALRRLRAACVAPAARRLPASAVPQ